MLVCHRDLPLIQPLMLSCKQVVFGMTLPKIKPRPPNLRADALTIRLIDHWSLIIDRSLILDVLTSPHPSRPSTSGCWCFPHQMDFYILKSKTFFTWGFKMAAQTAQMFVLIIFYLLSVQTHLCRRWAPALKQGNPVTPVWTQPRHVTSMRRVNVYDLPTTPSAARPRPLSPLWPIRSRAAGKDVRRFVKNFIWFKSDYTIRRLYVSVSKVRINASSFRVIQQTRCGVGQDTGMMTGYDFFSSRSDDCGDLLHTQCCHSSENNDNKCVYRNRKKYTWLTFTCATIVMAEINQQKYTLAVIIG